MQRTTTIMLGLALGTALFIGTVTQAADAPKAQPGPGPNCPFYGQGMGKGRQGNAGGGMGMGQQKRYGWGKGQGQGQGKGFRGGPRDGTGPRRDGSCGRCLLNES
jgi:Spy/CpxP family protein refolding chaperone